MRAARCTLSTWWPPIKSGNGVLLRLGEQLYILEGVELALVARALVVEKLQQHLQPLVQHVAPARLGEAGIPGRELLAIGAQTHAEDEAPVGELVEAGDLFGQIDRVAHGEHEQRRPQTQRGGGSADRHQRDQRLVEGGRLAGKQLAHVVLSGDVVVAPHRIVAEPFAELAQSDEILRLHERDRIHDALEPGRKTDAEFHDEPPAGRPAAAMMSSNCSGSATPLMTISSSPADR